MSARPAALARPAGGRDSTASPPARGEGRDTRHCPPGGRDDSRADLPGEGSPGSPASPGGAGLPGGGGSQAPPSPAIGNGAFIYFQKRGEAGSLPLPTLAPERLARNPERLGGISPPPERAPGILARLSACNRAARQEHKMKAGCREGCSEVKWLFRSECGGGRLLPVSRCFSRESYRAVPHSIFCPYLSCAVASERSLDDPGTWCDEMDLAD